MPIKLNCTVEILQVEKCTTILFSNFEVCARQNNEEKNKHMMFTAQIK